MHSSSSWKRRICLGGLTAALLTAPAAAETAAPSEADRAAAQALFDQGRKLIEAGDFAQACEKLRASNDLDPGVGTLLYLADCYERGQRLASAFQTFEEARTAAEARKDAERAKIAAVRAAALKPRLVYVVIELGGEAPEGLEVRANGRVVPPESFGQPQPIDEGTLSVVASAPGRTSAEVALQIVGGTKTPYRATIPELASTQPAEGVAPPPTLLDETPKEDVARDAGTEDPGSGQRTVAWIIGGVGVASLIVSGVFTALASSDNEDSKGECNPDDPNRCSVRGKSLRDDALSEASIATVAGIVGGVGLAAGVTLYLTAPSATGEERVFAIGVEGSF